MGLSVQLFPAVLSEVSVLMKHVWLYLRPVISNDGCSAAVCARARAQWLHTALNYVHYREHVVMHICVTIF